MLTEDHRKVLADDGSVKSCARPGCKLSRHSFRHAIPGARAIKYREMCAVCGHHWDVAGTAALRGE
jgi:hypothetical protein